MCHSKVDREISIIACRLPSYFGKLCPEFPGGREQVGRQFRQPFDDVGHVGLHRLVAVQSPAHAEESNQMARTRFYHAPAKK